MQESGIKCRSLLPVAGELTTMLRSTGDTKMAKDCGKKRVSYKSLAKKARMAKKTPLL